MITYQADENGRAIDGNGNLVELPNAPRLYNGTHVLVFESNQEKQQYIESIPQAWSKENYAQLLNDAHDALYQKLWKERGYTSEAEIAAWEDTLDQDTLSKAWKAEAKALLNWYRKTCITVYKYLETVTEQTALPVDDFINSLPAFQL